MVQSLGQDDLAASIKCDIDGLAHKDSLEKFRGVVTHVCQAIVFDWQLVRDFLASYRKVTNDKSPEQFTDLSPGLCNVFEKILELWSKMASGSEKEIIAAADYEQASQVLDALLLQEGIAAQACMSIEAFAKDGKEFQAMMMAVPFFLLCAFCIVACTLLLFTHLAFVHDCYTFAACAFPCEIGVALRICVFCAVRFFRFCFIHRSSAMRLTPYACLTHCVCSVQVQDCKESMLLIYEDPDHTNPDVPSHGKDAWVSAVDKFRKLKKYADSPPAYKEGLFRRPATNVI